VRFVKQDVLYHGFGFPVLLKGVEYKGEGAHRYLDIPHENLARSLFEILLRKQTPLTGVELRFIRHELDLTQSRFAKLVHAKSHSNVLGWERRGDAPTGLTEPAEMFVRLQAAVRLLGRGAFAPLFGVLSPLQLGVPDAKPLVLEVGKAP
jgi:DNA-binding transcriptional regulator YiaG